MQRDYAGRERDARVEASGSESVILSNSTVLETVNQSGYSLECSEEQTPFSRADTSPPIGRSAIRLVTSVGLRHLFLRDHNSLPKRIGSSTIVPVVEAIPTLRATPNRRESSRAMRRQQ